MKVLDSANGTRQEDVNGMVKGSMKMIKIVMRSSQMECQDRVSAVMVV